MENVIGRKSELEELEQRYLSGRPEFVAIYGRRRVGKTFLVKQAFKGRITFMHTGVSPVEQDAERNKMRTQLESFYYSLLDHGLEGFKRPQTWMEAFYQLKQLLTLLDDGSRQLVFIDELPWMDTPRSGFLPAFESFWNGWCSGRDNLMLIVCGSATSWILGNMSRSRGGLYGRLTDEIKLMPFTLGECEQYFAHEQVELSRYDVLRAYMAFGGIPYYIGYFQKGLSFAANTDRILFGRNPRLKDEFNRLFNAIFTNADDCKKIVRLLATRHSGFTREEIAKGTGLPLGGGLTNTLAALEESDFILRYVPYGKSAKAPYYKLIDNFCLFWLKHVETNQTDGRFMTDHATSDIMRNWSGVAFEEVCWQHVGQIKHALGIAGVKSTLSAWSVRGDDTQEGVQIDLLIQREDNVVNLCEMKFAVDTYVIDKDEARKLQRRIEALKATLTPRQTVHLTMITTYGVANGKYSGVVQKNLTAEDLFSNAQ
ncbi:MAG: ATP-binding protein [Bacteroidales bacterium]|nr:ATP-binding protein [Bacteroidales bacterium]